ncbi:MAG: ABC transporter ATP-binding protein [Bacteroidetes bacterium]|jgi:putative ABC transport system ATP-binding protein|nr:ABC transporter ATP-binding protein [Bacteroidota bacterium]MBT3748218.1 ABC transporter ATP-binding protein [Bacteroidota bacterium]MBT4399184.1 ABC transporter ATP-binding protein [Bacteroidota bacterium]MBT4411503.1 ABC transporter ATP-binding protein [Bacteroidota bacterium]MBT7094046.1 ABC transporter ATP-binding protein [Bacteroidota bacterium]
MVRTEKLTKVFRTEDIETSALRGVDIHLSNGEFVAVMGPSGCGKSTLLNIIGMLDNSTSGTYIFRDTDITRYKEKDRTQFRKGNIGFIFQSFNLIDQINIYDNVELPLMYMKMKASERRKRIDEVLKRMKIGHRARHFPQQLSGGQQQRVAIARAVVAGPKLILADEPTGNLDSKNGIEVMNLLSDLNQEGTTILMVTHSDRDARFASRTINLLDGKVVVESAIEM